jgi:hypothetical protein
MKTASPSEFLAGCRFLSALKVVQRGVQRAFLSGRAHNPRIACLDAS